MKFRTFSIALLAAAATFASAGTELSAKPDAKGAYAGRWTQDYDAAVALARKDGLPLLLKFTGSDWCGWCKLMENNVFSQEEFAKWADGRVVLVTLDFPHASGIVPDEYKDRNAKLAANHGIKGFPTYVVKDAEEKELGRLGASRDATVGKFTKDFEALVGAMPEKKTPAIASDNVTAEEMEQWLRAQLTAAQQRAFREKLTDAERAEFPSLAFAGRDFDAARERLAQERSKFVEDTRKELAELAASDPDAAKERKEKALAELQKLDEDQAARLLEFKETYDRKSDRLRELVRKLN